MTEVSVVESVPSPATSACSSEVSLEEYNGDEGHHIYDGKSDHAEEDDEGKAKEEEEALETKPLDKPPTTPSPRRRHKSRESCDSSPRRIDYTLEKMLREPYKFILKKKKETKGSVKKSGFVYVFKHGESEEALMNGDYRVKVGFSKDPEARARNIESVCKRTIMHVLGDDMQPFETAEYAEKLAQQELEHWKSYAPCVCGKQHQEIFDTIEEHAMTVRQRWVSFCKREPWNENGELKPFWKDRLKVRQPVSKDFQHDCEDRRWDKFTMPGEHEEQFYHAVAVLRSLGDFLTLSMPALLKFRCSAVNLLYAVKVWWTYGRLDIFPVFAVLVVIEGVCYLSSLYDCPRKISF
jgi:hypothetical protein